MLNTEENLYNFKKDACKSDEIKKEPTYQTKHTRALFPLTGILFHRNHENKTLSHFKDGRALISRFVFTVALML